MATLTFTDEQIERMRAKVAPQPTRGRSIRVPDSIRQIRRDQIENRKALGSESGPLETAAISAGENLANIGRGAENTLLQAARSFLPQPDTANPANQFAVNARNELTGNIQENRDAAAESARLTEPLREQQPGAVFGGDVATFLAEVSLPGGAAKQGGRLARGLRTSAKEAGVGAGFGAIEVARTDEEKSRLIAFGLVTGAITPQIFEAGRKIRGFKEQDRVLELLEMEKNLELSGLLTTGELRGTRGLLKLEAGLDNIPLLGLGPKRRAQSEQIVEVSENLATKIAGGQFTEDDVLKGLLRQYDRNQAVVNQKFDELAKIDAGLNNQNKFGLAPGIEADNLRATAQELLDKELAIRKGAQDTAVIKELRTFVDDDQPITFEAARDTMSRLLEDIRVQTAQSGRGEKTDAKLRTLGMLQSAHQRDIEEWASVVGGEPLQKWQEAKNAFKDLLLPYRKSPTLADGVRGRVDEFSIDTFVGDFIKASEPRRTAAMINSLDDSGKQASRYLVIREALSNSTEGGEINGAEFGKQLERLSNVWETSFTAKQKQILTGFVRLSGLSRRAFNRPQAIGPLITAGTLSSSSGAGAKVSAILGARYLLGTDAGRRILVSGANARNNRELRAATAAAEMLINRSLEQIAPEQLLDIQEYAESQ